jgi:hypothetical protein
MTNASRGWGQSNALVMSGGCDKVLRVWQVKSGLVFFLCGSFLIFNFCGSCGVWFLCFCIHSFPLFYFPTH